MELEAKITKFLQGDALKEQEDSPDTLARLIKEIVPKKELNTTRILYENGTIYFTPERQEEVLIPASILPQKRKEWHAAWQERQRKIETRKHGPK